MKIKTLLLLLSFLQVGNSKSPLDDACGDWAPYNDEKCFKVFDQDLVSYNNAENVCKNEDSALLPSITTEEKQQFIEDLLKSQNVVDNVWIGLKYADENYVWADGTKANYTHWTSGSPSNDSNYCVQIETENGKFGYWAEIACSKKNLFICEKPQLWSLSKLQSTVMNILVTLTNIESKLTSVQTALAEDEATLTNVVENPVPIGFIYVQLPKEKPPQEIWSGVQFEDVTSDYAGLFFRAYGGNSMPFGETQDESSPRLDRVGHYEAGLYPNGISVPRDGTPSEVVFTGYDPKDDAQRNGLAFTLSKEEVCPRNTAILIWKRTS